MENDFAKHETDYIKQYEKVGYSDSYQFVDGNLRSLKTEKVYSPTDITIVKEHRYEGMSNPDDMSILYVIQTSDDGKGTLLVGYGPSANTDLFEFISKIPEENIKDENILPPDAEK
ncbi:hypothetical protein [Costertonia aggregata]|uniref:Phosphoribosylpyrophosphate synthetase n=1 Tax=Costertonia aggregata TaxID=343403 RepID=A0A7H9ASS9_9FLAO|nr:hypothetical protein [Costertonia aggregata]QLG46499.1 hypothetical protein HYG79_14465 [Costertonia aggregata]